MKKHLLLLSALLLAIPTVATAQLAADHDAHEPKKAATMAIENTADVADLQGDLRSLWTGHVFWVRSVVFATHYDDSAASAAAEDAVAANARALANALTPYYGQEAADGLFPLLAGHYGAIKEYMTASFADDTAAREAAMANVSANAEEIAAFLETANPNLPSAKVLPLLIAHGGHHAEQIAAVHSGDFAKEAAVWTAIVDGVYTISDAMADAIAQQFPEKVSG